MSERKLNPDALDDLYWALRALLSPSDPMKPTETEPLFAAARAALSKARGESV